MRNRNARRIFGQRQKRYESVSGYVEGAATRATHAGLKAQAREQLGDEAFEAALRKGSALGMEEAIAYAMRG